MSLHIFSGFVCSLLLVTLLTGQGWSQCYSNTNCTGDIAQSTVEDQRECCVGTNDGLSFSDGSNCNLCIGIIRASVDALCRDDTSEISRDPGTKRLQTRRESLARPSEHTNNNF